MALTYNGATAGSTLANPPVVLAAGIAGKLNWVTSGSTVGGGPGGSTVFYGSGAKVWFYASTNTADEMANAIATIGDGNSLGMTLGDIFLGVQTTAGSTAPKIYIGALATSGGSTGFSLSPQYLTSTDKTSG